MHIETPQDVAGPRNSDSENERVEKGRQGSERRQASMRIVKRGSSRRGAPESVTQPHVNLFTSI
jgi:hypothetical protein